MAAVEAGVVVLALILAAVVAWISYSLKQQRIKDLASAAARLGLEFSHEDPFALPDRPFALFAKGDGRGAENVMWGVRDGHEVIAADYWYFETTHHPKGGTSRTYYRFSCALARLDLVAPHLTIEPENILTRFADVVGFRDIEFESEEFNRAVQVKCEDRKFANYLIDARMMEWLLGARDWAFEVHGDEVLVFCDRLRPHDVPVIVDALLGFKAQVPRAALDTYGVQP